MNRNRTSLWAPRRADSVLGLWTGVFCLAWVLVQGAPTAAGSQRLLGVRIGVDAGHGGSDTGAVGPNLGLTEKGVNLATALALRSYLQAEGATVVMTRTGDATVSISSRSTLFVNSGVDLAISVHHNAGSASANSTMVFVYCDRPLATRAALASAVVQRLAASTGATPAPSPASTSGTLCSGRSDWRTGLAGVGQANLHMVRVPETEAGIPSILVEVSFLSNPAEEAKLADPDYLDSNGWAIYAGVAEHFGFTPKPRGGGVGPATVATLAPTLVTGETARLWGRIMDNGGTAILERRLEWGREESWMGFSSLVQVAGNDFYFDLAGLSPNTTHQFRAWARNAEGWAQSSPRSFTTGNPSSHTIVLAVSPGGAGEVAGAGVFAAGSTRTVAARSRGGYTFSHWTDGTRVVNTSPIHTLKLDGEVGLTAVFRPVAGIQMANPAWREGVFSFDVEAVSGLEFVVERTVDLGFWIPIRTNTTPILGVVRIEEAGTGGATSVIYRVRGR